MNINIRKSIEIDISSIIELQKSWQKENITYGFQAADEAYLKTKLGDYFYVAELDNEIVGFIYGALHKAKDMSIFDDGTIYVEIDDLFTLRKYRSLGIGKKLLDQILDVAKNSGIDHSLLYSSTKDIEKTINFYERSGYKSWNIQMYK